MGLAQRSNSVANFDLVVLGGGIGIGIRGLLEGRVSANQADGILILVSATTFFIAGLLALRIKREQLGSLPHEVKKQSVAAAYQEMIEGARFLYRIRDCFRGITATAVQRGGLTALVLMALLLNRNTFNDPSDPEAGLAGFAFAITVAGIGITIGAIIAPFGVQRLGRHAWIRYSLYASAILPIALAFEQNQFFLVATGFFAGMAGQGEKVTNDALVQSKIDDVFRGRVFAVYDVLVNGAIVTGALIAAWVLPISGDTWILPLMISVAWALVALVLLRPQKFFLKGVA